MNAASNYVVEIKSISWFRLSEEVIDSDVEKLAQLIISTGRWTAPIPVEAATGIIMDGNHRWHAAKRLGLTHIPCVLLDYADPQVAVFDWNTGLPFELTQIFQTGKEGRVFPYKTTRHLFSTPLPQVDVALQALSLPECVAA